MKKKKVEEPIALKAYEELARHYADLISTKAENAYYERPATLSLLPDVNGKKILDAGCGPGTYSEWLADHGARVTAVDISPRMLKLARLKLGSRVEFRKVNLEKALDFVESGSFDIILSSLVLDYVRNWKGLMAEFSRILKGGGFLILSVGHPFSEYKLRGRSRYYDTELVETVWTGFGIPVKMPSYRRPLDKMINTIIESGFKLDRIIEPVPTEELKEKSPKVYQHMSELPGFLCIRAIKE